MGGDISPSASYSNVIEGIIDTALPTLFQFQPADNVLSGGDEISVSYNETLDCDFIDQAVFTHENISGHSPGSSEGEFPLLPTCIDNKVVLNMDGSVAAHTVENDTIRIVASNVRDLVGNISEDSYVWEFLFNQNPISWSVPKIEGNVYIGDNATITTTLLNIGGSTSTFEFGERNVLPEWLSIDPMQGWLNSQGQTEITFTLDPYMDIGPVNRKIYAENSSGDEPIILDLEILCRPPTWEYDDSDFQYSMQIVGQLEVENNYSTDTFDRVVATVNGEVRGVAQLEEFTNDEGTETLDLESILLIIVDKNKAIKSLIGILWDIMVYSATYQDKKKKTRWSISRILYL